MKIIFAFLFLTFSFLSISQNSIPCNSVSEFFQVRGTDFVKYDPVLGSFSVIDQIHIGNDTFLVNAIGYNVKDNYIYGLRVNPANEVVRIGISPGGQSIVVTSMGLVQNLPTNSPFHTGDFDDQGFLYVTRNNFNKVYKIDPILLIYTEIDLVDQSNNSVNANCADFCFNSNDSKFYGMAGNGNLLQLDLLNSGMVKEFQAPFSGDSNTACNAGFGAAFADKSGSVYFFCNSYGTPNARIELFRIDNPDSAPICNNISQVMGVLLNNDGAACPLSNGLEDDDPFDPCCPPITKESIVELFHHIKLGSVNDNYRLEFVSTTKFENLMQAYIDLLNLTCGATNLHFSWNLDEITAFGGNIVKNVEKEYFHFVSNGNGAIQNNSGFFNNPGSECEPGKHYRVRVGIYPDNKLNCFDKVACSADLNFEYYVQIVKSGKVKFIINGMADKKLTIRSN